MRKPGQGISTSIRRITLQTGIGLNMFFQDTHTLEFKVRKVESPKIEVVLPATRITTLKNSFSKSSKNKPKKFKQKTTSNR